MTVLISIFSLLFNDAPESLMMLVGGVVLILFTVVLRRWIKYQKTVKVHLTEGNN